MTNNQITVYELNNAERFLLISFRLWALPIAMPDRDHMDWRAGFRTARIDEVASTAFDTLLATLFSSSKRTIEVHRAMCVGMSRDEREFIRCISLHQNDQLDAAAEILETWLSPTAARVAASQAGNFSEAIRGAGLFLPCRKFESASARNIPVGVGHGLYFVH